jgi:hypothetical protein
MEGFGINAYKLKLNLLTSDEIEKIVIKFQQILKNLIFHKKFSFLNLLDIHFIGV